MFAEFGHFALVTAFAIAICQGMIPLYGYATQQDTLIATAKPLALLQGFALAVSFAVLTHGFLVHDFSIHYVANNSNLYLPWYFRMSAVWGAHEGSLLLWALILAGWGVAVSLFSRGIPEHMAAIVLSVMGMIGIGFIAFMLFTSNPFERLLPFAPANGKDLNPLLQDPGLIFHPPMLYMGYVGLSVAYAFAMAALIAGRLDATWARWSRPWTTIAWSFLTFGIALGSWWAYYELGWGGWWFWDPVENASLIPWLVATALMHSLAVTEKRGLFRSWTVLLAIAAFSLSLLGTFLVRSGVLTSVHAFANDPERGVFILGFLIVVIGGSLTLYAIRAAAVSEPGRFGWLSRESWLLFNNLMLTVLAVSVLLGTLYPLLVDAVGGGKVSVGPPFFNAVFVPLTAILVSFMVFGPLTSWQHMKDTRQYRPLIVAAIVSILVGALWPTQMLGDYSIASALGTVLALWLVLGTLLDIWQRRLEYGSAWVMARKVGAGFFGMWVAHIGVAVTVFGVAMVENHTEHRDVRMGPGDVQALGPYEVRFIQMESLQGPNYSSEMGTFEVWEGSRLYQAVTPEKRVYSASQMTMTEAAIDPGFTRDLYIALGEPLGDGDWAVRLSIKPFVDWIWGGSFLMGFGGIIAILDRRYRRARARQQQPVTPAEQATVV
ncbi:MAG: heme lyase CcmF/NrfE family subunit [Gammaproteobacteria bacterium]|nr:heme lyase CcmF/NrfE family subunit [Gammaproteobacteria bacterium]